MASGPALGDVEAGVVAALVGARVSLVSGGLACIAGVGLMALLLPEFHRYDAPAMRALRNTRCLNYVHLRADVAEMNDMACSR
ncbi:hypothetical protein BH20ACT21_BH20ACT21_05340 [soil metagenome]